MRGFEGVYNLVSSWHKLLLVRYKFITQSVKMSEIYHSQCYEIFSDHVKIIVSRYLNDEIKTKYI